ncbi:MAG: NAD(P)H-hydrate dehydratase [Planctomycetales bacterium 4484_123]|nr:MAG: NAD(P)H-hydrate dehydratase [Planctomycetales bacterium 4484_123]
MPERFEPVQSPPLLPARRRQGHKGDFGRVLVVGGSRGMIGAPALAANAALRGGAGLVTVAVPEPVQLAVASLCPCATSVPLPCVQSGRLAQRAVREVLTSAQAADVLAVGPGMGVSPPAAAVVRAVLGQSKSVVLDADGLNNLRSLEGWPVLRQCPLVLTPHPGEFARLTGKAVCDIQADRQRAAVAAAAEWTGAGQAEAALVVVLKGAGTVVTDGKRVFVNGTGNPGMATGGSGDVLTGLVAALMGQGMEPFEAACLGVHVHGLAGDLAAERLGEISVMATDLIDHLPAAFRRLESGASGSA